MIENEVALSGLIHDLISIDRSLQESASLRDTARITLLLARRRILVDQMQGMGSRQPQTDEVLRHSPEWRLFRLQEQATMQALRLAQSQIAQSLVRLRRRVQTVRAYATSYTPSPMARSARLDRRG